MAETGEIKKYLIFIAHSEEVSKERETAIKIIERINRVHSKYHKSYVEAFWWDYEPPAAGRPQESLNLRVDQCDIFLGIIGESWGQPPHTKKYSSGFEEEFHRALDRYKKTNGPKIWIFLRDINEQRLADPGPKLKQNLKFRKYLKTTGEVTYKKYRAWEDFGGQLYDFLVQFINDRSPALEIARSAENIGQMRILPGREKIGSNLQAAPIDNPSFTMPMQLLNLATNLANDLSDPEMDFESDEFSLTDPISASRLNLLLARYISDYHTGELLSGHLANLLFRHRSKIEITPLERAYVFRSMLGNSNVPGWYWFRDLSFQSIIKKLAALSASDPDEEVRKGALRILKENAIPQRNMNEIRQKICENVLNDKNDGIRDIAIDYVNSVFLSGDWNDIEPIIRSSIYITPAVVLEIKTNVFLNDNPDAAMEIINSEISKVPTKIVGRLNSEITKVNDKQLKLSLRHMDDNVAYLAAKELFSRRKITPELANGLLQTAPDRVKYICYKEMIKEGRITDISILN